MAKTLAIALALACMLAVTPAVAHHGPSVLGTMQIMQPLRAGGEILQPGTYEVRLTGEHVTPLPGQSENAEQVVEFVANGKVMARDVAEVREGEARPIGTSGNASTRARTERLKADPFVRVSMAREGNRYLIYLPLANQ
jgi:hypothetical protein